LAAGAASKTKKVEAPVAGVYALLRAGALARRNESGNKPKKGVSHTTTTGNNPGMHHFEIMRPVLAGMF
jgi:hypothetical protein